MFGEDGVPLSGRFTTLYPFPGTTSVKPWSAKSLYTLLAVLRLIPSSAASVRQLGNQLPTGYSPIDGQALAADTNGLELASVVSMFSLLSYAIGHSDYIIVLKVCQ